MHPAPRFRVMGRVVEVIVDMLAVGFATLFYDGAVAAIVFCIEFLRYSKVNTKISEATHYVLAIGLLGGILAVVGLLFNRKYHRAFAVLVGLLPLALLVLMVYKVL